MGSQTFYSVLQVTDDATFEEIRKSYKNLVLTCHPDKCNDKEHEFISVTKAWEILSNTAKRKHYDAQLEFQKLQTFAVSEEVNINDFDRDDDYNFYYICRCQNDYVLTKEDTDYLIKFVTCSGCSQTIEVIYGSNDL